MGCLAIADSAPRETIRSRGQTFVYLAYLDDSDTKDKAEKWQVMACVMIPDTLLSISETWASLVIESLIPENQVDKFEEFHASELFGGYGIFEPIEQRRRHEALEGLLHLIPTFDISIAYGAVDLEHLKQQHLSSANSRDIAARYCIKGIQQWLEKGMLERVVKNTIDPKVPLEPLMALLIAHAGNKRDMFEIQKSFREMRKRVRPPNVISDDLFHFHDDMYFGDSKFSLGIQLADVCAFFIAKHLEQRADAEGFYQIIASNIVFSRTLPEEIRRKLDQK